MTSTQCCQLNVLCFVQSQLGLAQGCDAIVRIINSENGCINKFPSILWFQLWLLKYLNLSKKRKKKSHLKVNRCVF